MISYKPGITGILKLLQHGTNGVRQVRPYIHYKITVISTTFKHQLYEFQIGHVLRLTSYSGILK